MRTQKSAAEGTREATGRRKEEGEARRNARRPRGNDVVAVAREQEREGEGERNTTPKKTKSLKMGRLISYTRCLANIQKKKYK